MTNKAVYHQSMELIFKLTAARLMKRKNDLNQILKEQGSHYLVTNEIIAGRKGENKFQDDFNEVVTIEMVSHILNNKRSPKKNTYLFPNTFVEYYYDQICKNLKFDSYYEMLWGTDDQIKEYLPNVFHQLMNDARNGDDVSIRILFNNVLEAISLEKPKSDEIRLLYAKIQKEFFDEWKKFTSAQKESINLALVLNDENNWSLTDDVRVKVYNCSKQNKYLGLFKLDILLAYFVSARLKPLVLKAELNRLSDL
ncbi:MAG: hypothetical protein ABF662_06840 [Liquorilactobacillus satsumensis]|uniref:hypothetical protein n=1 Tax=Liquorilactobacillus satsumensis TaxID=259059 RepID=UPI0039E833D5